MKKAIILILILFTSLSSFAQNEYGLIKRVKAINFGTGFGESGIPLYFNSEVKIFENFYTSPEISMSFYSYEGYSGRAISAAWRFNYYFNNVIGTKSNNLYYFGIILATEKWLYDYKYKEYFPRRDTKKFKLAIGMNYYLKENLFLNIEALSLGHNELRIGINKRF